MKLVVNGSKALKVKLNILVLCTGNSARSIMAEALFNSIGSSYFKAWSAGSQPTGKVNPYALEKIAALGYAANDVSSQSWHEFEQEHAPHFDIVMTVCGNAAVEDCPVFNGDWSHVHWGLPDPADSNASPEESRASFASCFDTLKQGIELVVSALQELDRSYNSQDQYRADVLTLLEQQST
jgi:arsenate reductase